jgi:uncharacterized protein (TIGR00369 family)
MTMDEMLAMLKEVYEERMPFDRLLGVQVVELGLDGVRVRLDMREELVGNFVRNILHGGVISALLDLTGGLMATVELLKHLEGATMTELGARLARIGTIDMRVDYLRPGQGKYFVASGAVLRKGSKVAVVRTELCNDREVLIAAGTGTYLVG